MTVGGRSYVDGGTANRTILVYTDSSGRDAFGNYDPIAHEKLDAINSTLINNFAVVSNSVSIPTTALTTIAEIDCRFWKSVGLKIQNDGTEVLAELQLQVKWTQAETVWVAIASTANDFDLTLSPNHELIRRVSGTLPLLPSASHARLNLDVSGVGYLRVQGRSGTVANTVVTTGICKL
jgi:hypothetical protein